MLYCVMLYYVPLLTKNNNDCSMQPVTLHVSTLYEQCILQNTINGSISNERLQSIIYSVLTFVALFFCKSHCYNDINLVLGFNWTRAF